MPGVLGVHPTATTPKPEVRVPPQSLEVLLVGTPSAATPCCRWSPLWVEARLGGAAGSRSSLEGLDPWTEIPPLEAMLRPQVLGAPPTRCSEKARADPLGLWPPLSPVRVGGSLHSCPPASSFSPSPGPCHPRSDLTRPDEAPPPLEAIRGGHSGFTPRAGAQGSRDCKRASLSGREGSAASPPVRCSGGCRQRRGRGGTGGGGCGGHRPWGAARKRLLAPSPPEA